MQRVWLGGGEAAVGSMPRSATMQARHSDLDPEKERQAWDGEPLLKNKKSAHHATTVECINVKNGKCKTG